MEWKRILIVVLLLLLGLFMVRCLHPFAPLSSTENWPSGDNTVVFYADVFTSPLTQKSGLFFLDLDERNLVYWQSVVTGSHDYATVFWVTQKQQLLFKGSIDSVYGLYFVDKEGNTKRIETIDLRSSIDHSISPDGSFMAFIHEEELYIQDIEGLLTQRLTSNNFIDREPNWSPDGQELVFRTHQGGFSAIVRINRDGTDPRLLIQNRNPLNDPVWSPDGRMIAFTEGNQRFSHSLWIMNADGTNARPILTPVSDDDTVYDLAWSPDSKYIVFVSSRDGYCGLQIEYQRACTRSLYLIDVSTGKVTRLTDKWLFYISLTWAN